MSDSRRLAQQHELHGLQPVLAVRDLAASLRFYCDQLGLELDFVWGEPAHYGRVKNLGFGAPIYLHLSQGAPDDAIAPVELRLHVGRDVDGLFAAYRDRGVALGAAPADQPWGLREFELRDPDGHLLIFGAESSAAADGADAQAAA
ncbi:MAG: VOC family protein [Burkholderiaceae bacterium]|jgi:catechol 2,3-dioxygenase-like lactoylglutathione lyase family enzyme|nr:VOC family protein [Burkholderiaceae bacterium]